VEATRYGGIWEGSGPRVVCGEGGKGSGPRVVWKRHAEGGIRTEGRGEATRYTGIPDRGSWGSDTLQTAEFGANRRAPGIPVLR
jgi:hypothetical protein